MDAVVATRDDPGPWVVDRLKPEPEPGEALVRILRVGVDGVEEFEAAFRDDETTIKTAVQSDSQ